MEPIGDDANVCEMVIYRDPKISQHQATFVAQPDISVWRTRDLFRKHPTKNIWLFTGRLDDVIVLSNGEKFNPVTMENMISGHSKVSGVLVVGLRRTQCALLLEARNSEDGDSLIDEVWPTIQRANKVSPGHAQIARNMILVISPRKPFQRAGKGTILRAAALKDYATEIDQLYGNAESSVSSTVDLPSLDYATGDGIIHFVRKLVALQMEDKIPPGDSTDLFSAGFDSLQTTQLSTNIRAALKTQIRDGQKITPRLVYENPSIEKIARALQAILDSEVAPSKGQARLEAINGHLSGEDRDAADAAKAESVRVLAMEKVIQKFSSTLSTTRPTDQISAETGTLNVLVTGTTGSLGQYLVEALSADPKVEHIYCFNRSLNAEEKFHSRATSVQNDRLEFFQVSLGEPEFDLPSNTLERLIQDVNVIIHNSWKVSTSLFNPVT
jgi:hypothetical protein